MLETNILMLGILIVLAFAWRFYRTWQLYLTTKQVLENGAEAVPFHPQGLDEFIQQSLLGRRSVQPGAFYIRALVYGLIAIILLPFKGYQPALYWLAAGLIIFYLPWRISFGIRLKAPPSEGPG